MMHKLYLFLSSFLLCLTVGKGHNCTKKTSFNEECSIRYDLVTGLAKAVFDEMNCETWYNKQFCICNSDLTIWYFNSPPYVFTLPNGTLDGILPAMLKLALKACCKNCTRLFYQKPFKSMVELSKQFYNVSYYQVLMPAIGIKEARYYFSNPYVRLINSPGVAFIYPDNIGDVVMNRLLKSLYEAWPLFALILLLTIQGGVIIWLLDTRKNPDEFPQSFIRGSLEGSWWAYISMTTVGYGDKSPRSFGGRVFAVFWITTGIVISGIFTASISSTLTSAAIGETTKINGKTVGFLRHVAIGYEENIIYRDGANAIGYRNISHLINALKNESIQGILIDRYTLRYYWKHFANSGIKLIIKKDIKNTDTGFGLTFSSKRYEDWAHFLRTFIEENKDAESRLLKMQSVRWHGSCQRNLQTIRMSQTMHLGQPQYIKKCW
ncbi:uncharacterized protein LOC135690676 [Rhopilema esculentum]|uniref:uncharacterized protein LOC135690676 n=1 Tax=Rhopilema esculentum TaxID=499914 RepID=UPI0031DB6A53